MSTANQWCVPDDVQDEALPVDFERSLSSLEVDLCTSSNNMNSVFAVPEISMRKEEHNSSSVPERCQVEYYPLSIANGKKIRYSQLTDIDCNNSVKRFCFNKEAEHSENYQSGRCRPHSHSAPELRTSSSHFYSSGSVINTFLSQVVQLPVMPISQTITDQGSQGPPALFYCILLAPTSISTKMNEDTLTYLNQGQPYEIRIKKSSNIPYDRSVLFKSVARIGFQERRLQYMEKEQIKEWQFQRPGERILELDLPLSYGIIEANNCTSINECEFIWDPNHDVGVYLKVNCISTEFTPKKHGGEKGVPFRVLIETFVNTHQPERLHAASCQVKVFKPKGADRKHKTDREKMFKRPQNDKEKYHPQYDYTILKDVTDSWSVSHSSFSSSGVSPISSSPASSGPQSPPFDCCMLSSPKQDCFDGQLATSTTESVEAPETDLRKSDSLSFDTPTDECMAWLQRNMFGSFVKDFISFTGADILNLTRADLIDICGAANGIRLYNALHGKGCLTTYVRLPSQKAYSAIFLKSTRVLELIAKVKSFCGLSADYNCDFYISGPAGTRVIVTDEVVSNMLQDSLFVVEYFERTSDEDSYVLLKQMN